MSAPDRPVAAQLELERARTVARIVALERDLAVLFAATEDAPDDEHDPEGATIGFERAQVNALLTAARRRLVELDEADGRVAAGSYGVCAVCGRRIGAERLTALPATRRCVGCAD